MGADEVPPMVGEDLVKRIIAEDAGAVSHSVYPADVKRAFRQQWGKTGAGGQTVDGSYGNQLLGCRLQHRNEDQRYCRMTPGL